jgi:O-antigen ligase
VTTTDWRRWVERAYVVVLVLAMTNGPVSTIWIRQNGGEPGDTFVATLEVTYFAVTFPALALLARRGLARVDRSVAALLLALGGWMTLTTLWSTHSAATAIASVSLLATAAAAIYVASTFTIIEVAWVTFVAAHIGLVASKWAIRRRWQGSKHDFGAWTGIYLNRNFLAPVAAFGIIAGVAIVWFSCSTRRGRWWPAWAGLAAVASLWDVHIIDGADSATSVAVLGVAAACLVVCQAARFLVSRRSGVSQRSGHRDAVVTGAAVGGVAFVVGLVALAMAADDLASRLFGRPAGFDGRFRFWRASWSGITERPIAGWGWEAAWISPSFRARLDPTIVGQPYGHSGLLDLVVGGGIVAAAIFVCAFGIGVFRAGRTALSDDPLGWWPFTVATAALVYSTQESFLRGDHFVWLLFGAVMVGLRPDDAVAPLESSAVARDVQPTRWALASVAVLAVGGLAATDTFRPVYAGVPGSVGEGREIIVDESFTTELANRTEGSRWTVDGRFLPSFEGLAPAADVSTDPARPDELAVTDLGITEYALSLTMNRSAADAGLVFRYHDRDNYWAMVAAPQFATWGILEVRDGVSTLRANTGLSAQGDNVRIELVNSPTRFTVAINGAKAAELSTGALGTSTAVGIIARRHVSAAARFGRMVVFVPLPGDDVTAVD